MTTHSLQRTNPVGQPFIGRCVLCGAANLPATAARTECINPAGVTQEQALLDAVTGEGLFSQPNGLKPDEAEKGTDRGA